MIIKRSYIWIKSLACVRTIVEWNLSRFEVEVMALVPCIVGTCRRPLRWFSCWKNRDVRETTNDPGTLPLENWEGSKCYEQCNSAIKIFSTLTQVHDRKKFPVTRYPVNYKRPLGSSRNLLYQDCTTSPKRACVGRELKHRRFWATDVNRKSKLLLFDAYYTLFIQKVKL